MKISKKLVLLFSCTCLCFFSEIALNIACGPEMDPYDNRQTYYLPNLEDNSFSAFQFIPYQFLFTDQEPISEAEINAEDWVNHLGNMVKKEDVISFMYRSDAETTRLLQENSSASTLPDSIRKNTFVQSLLMSKHKQELAYFNFTKDQEPVTNIAQDPWNPDERNFDEIRLFAEKAEENLAKVKKNNFLKIRYAYQAARLYLFAKDFSKSILTYEKYFSNAKSKSPVYQWALSNYAGAIRKNGEEAKAAYLFSKVFIQSPERRILAYQNFHYITAEESEIFAYAQNNADAFNINAIIGFNNPSMNMHYLQKCYELDPANTINAVLLAREVNKLEPYFIKNTDLAFPNYNRYQEENTEQVNTHLQALRTFALKLYEDKKYIQPNLGLVTAAYLSWLNKENELAKTQISQVTHENMNVNLKDQYRITDMLTQLTDWQNHKSLDEDKLIATLKWLQEKSQLSEKKQNDEDYSTAFENSSYSLISRNIIQNIIVDQYLIQGDTAMASIAAVKADIFYNYGNVQDTLEKNMQYSTVLFWQSKLTPKSIIKIQDYIDHPDQQKPMVKFLMQDIKNINKNYITELLGTTYLRELDFENAVKTFKKLPQPFKSKAYSNWYSDQVIAPNPFIETINDFPKNYGKTSITKIAYANNMLRLQNLIKGTRDKAKKAAYYYEMANGIYQTSTYGNAWSLVSYEWSSYDNQRKADAHWERNYVQTKTAKDWYLKARELSVDKNFKAKCTFMLAKCEQKDFILTDELRWQYYDRAEENPFYQFSIQNKYFQQLKNSYSNTDFYKIAVHECTYLSDFMK